MKNWKSRRGPWRTRQLADVDDKTENNDLYIENKEENSIQDKIETPWDNELNGEIEIKKNIKEDKIVEEENTDENLSEQEYQQDSDHEVDDAIIDKEVHASGYVSFPKAVKLAFKNYFNFSDRSSRSEYWFFLLFIILLEIAFIFLADVIPSDTFAIITVVTYILYIIPSISVSVRRLHDIDKRGWWIFISVIPVIGWVFLIILHCQEGNIKENRFGVKTLGAE